MTTISLSPKNGDECNKQRRRRLRLLVVLVVLGIVSIYNVIQPDLQLTSYDDLDDEEEEKGGRRRGDEQEDDEHVMPSTGMTSPSYRSMKEVTNKSPLVKIAVAEPSGSSEASAAATPSTKAVPSNEDTLSSLSSSTSSTKKSSSVVEGHGIATKKVKTTTTESSTKSLATSMKTISGTSSGKKVSQQKPTTHAESATSSSTTIKKGTVDNTKKQSESIKKMPSNWVARTPVGLDLQQPFVEQRHYCLSKVREKHIEALVPVIFGNNVVTRTDPTTGKKVMDVLLVDPAYHGNVGDHMLTTGEHIFIRDISLMYNISMPTKQCHYNQAQKIFPYCTWSIQNEHKHIKTSKVALWHAGGNFGDLWRGIHEKRLSSMSLLLQNGYNVVGMPQSLYFKNKDLSNADALTLKDEISRGLNLSESVLDSPEGIRLAKERVTLTWREIVSYEEAKVLYPFVNNMLVPDIALRLGPFKPMRPRKFAKDTVDILIFLRKDIESKVAHVRDNHGWIQNALPNLPNNNTTKPTYRVVDWTDRKDIFQDDNILFTETSIQLISLGKVVVADRLHASILAYLTGVPFVYIDQVSGKVTKTLDGAFSDIPGCLDGEKAKWAKAGTLKEALSMATSFLPSE